MKCKDLIIYILIIIIFLYFLKTYKKTYKKKYNPPCSSMVPNEHSILVDNKFPIYTSKSNYYTDIYFEDNYNKLNNNLEISTDLNEEKKCLDLDFNYNKNYNNLEDISYLLIDNNTSIDNTSIEHIKTNDTNYIFNYDKSYNIQEQFDNEKLYKLF